MINKTLLGATATAFLAVVSSTISGNAVASDDHSYSGSYCKATYGAEATDFVTDKTGIKNNSTAYRFVTCPIPRDATFAFYGIDVGVWVTSNTTSTIGCYTYYVNKEANSFQSDWGGRIGTGSMIMNLINANVDPNTGLPYPDDQGHYNLACYLPPSVTLNSIYVREYTSVPWDEIALTY